MHTNTPIIQENDPMKDFLVEMAKKSLGCVCVVNEDNKIVGAITDCDLRRKITVNFLKMKACEVTTKNPKVVSSGAFSVTKFMNEHKITNLFESEDGTPSGIIHIHDCLSAGLV